MHLILASTSPRRKDLLSLLGVPFELAAPTFSEDPMPSLTPDEHARFHAEGKAQSCAHRFPDSLVLGSDTLITIDGMVLGKPVSRDEARNMLCRLRGRDHTIHTAVALFRHADGVRDLAMETVRVSMEDLRDADVEAYLRSQEWDGKAGAYAIQGIGGRLVRGIQGDYTAVVGLPLRLTASLLRARGVSIPVDIEQLYRETPYPNWAQFNTVTEA